MFCEQKVILFSVRQIDCDISIIICTYDSKLSMHGCARENGIGIQIKCL